MSCIGWDTENWPCNKQDTGPSADEAGLGVVLEWARGLPVPGGGG